MFGDCLEPRGFVSDDPRDYPRVGFHSLGIACHRLVWWMLHGPIPDGWIVHHECRNKRCINPDHLAAMTPQDHVRLHANTEG